MPEIIDALKDKVREAMDETQLHTIDNVFKNWTYRVGYCIAPKATIGMKLLSIINWKD